MSKLFILFLFFLTHCSDSQIELHSIEGRWKEIKSSNVYEKDRREILYLVEKQGEIYSGKIQALDNAIDGNGEIRRCFQCSDIGAEVLLGFPIIKDLKREKDHYSGKMYDVYQRKWFDLTITPKGKDRILLRIYAYFPFFGKSFSWERGEEYYKDLLSKSPDEINQPIENIYALSLGSPEKSNPDLEVVIRGTYHLNPGKTVYVFNSQGKKIAKGLSDGLIQNQLKFRLTEYEESSDFNQSQLILVFKN
ncbi:MAG: DUF2147 domain-containing protein [Leptospiraceae bacterium]|nr:DUF2147 domain-containing protein [Leptospiraceae bacterium]MCP5512787.1 DUF2147 domain-containing protein [Leptospiraceae bacterium]